MKGNFVLYLFGMLTAVQPKIVVDNYRVAKNGTTRAALVRLAALLVERHDCFANLFHGENAQRTNFNLFLVAVVEHVLRV